MAVLETTFVIDLMKEAKRRKVGPASSKLQALANRGETLRIAIFTVAELFVGVSKANRPDQERMAVEQSIAPFEILSFERNTAEIFGSTVGELEKQGQRIADIDALIASVALEHTEVLVTRNRRHFERIAGFRVESY